MYGRNYAIIIEVFMKNVKNFFIGAIIITSLFSASVFAGSCSVTVNYPDGTTREGIRVGGPGAKDVDTDRNGQATLSWGDNSTLSTVFVYGTDKHVSCSNGSSVSIVIKP
jgi:hypothetical protein